MSDWIRAVLTCGLAALGVFPAGYATVPSVQEPGPLVLVAGATGRTGQEVVKQLLARNYRVRGLVRNQPKAAEIFGSSVQYAVGDVREVATLPAAMKDA
ncbi:MAG: NAD(P)H-binding protein, partial [Acidobacteria bacterium]|nr:NAD(P)H-binding protein [Acidobacteriota bacterium]